MNHCLKIFWILLLSFSTKAQEVFMYPNLGQWDAPILWQVPLDQGNFFIAKDNFTFHFSNAKNLSHHHEVEHDGSEKVKEHVVRATFINSTFQGVVEKEVQSKHYSNYFIGKDSTRWKSKVFGYARTVFKDFYPQIDLFIDGKNAGLLYGFDLKNAQDFKKIQIQHAGVDRIYLDEQGDLHVRHSLGEIIQSKPKAWYFDEPNRPLNVTFQLNGDVVSFSFEKELDAHRRLIIDPSLTFSSFTGSTLDNWGMTAAPDPQGNLFAGGIVFIGTGTYPLMPGAFDSSLNGGQVDIAITKFNTDGTSLLYSTYIGGNGAETPHSIVSNSNGDIYVMGVTSSSDFPMLSSSYDASFNGGSSETVDGINFTSGTDIFVFKLNTAGSVLLGSTYMGGTQNDGLNLSTLQYNYGDALRGEVIIDNNENVYVASCTQSPNFPTQMGMQGSLSGGSDAVIFKFNTTLSNLAWSTYYGGSGDETGNSIQVNNLGNVYVTGGTSSSNLMVLNGHDVSYNGGLSDGYLVAVNGLNGTQIAGTFIGSFEYDQSFFVQIAPNNEVYVYGQSENDLGISPGKYGNVNAGQFVQKYSQNLATKSWGTTIGASNGHVTISPTAFLVSDCYDIYLSGWGGQLNQQYAQAAFSTTNGLSVTSDAYQATTNGSNFYIAVLGPEANTLKYATFMGGAASSYNHVDGGTSRFDKSGRIYHAVCGACGGNDNGFTTTPGAWATSNPSANCNLAAFKFELSKIEAVVANPAPLICLPDPVVFQNNSANGNVFAWDFGDGNTSNLENPSHVYAGPGDYTVTLTVSDAQGCYSPDVSTFVVHIGDFQGGVVQPTGYICPNEPFQLDAFGGSQYQWSPANVLDDPSLPNPIAVVATSTLFTVIISDSCGVDTLQVQLNVFDPSATVSNDTSICIGNSVQLWATGGVQYLWSPATFLDQSTVGNPISTPTSTTLYHVQITTADGCILHDSVQINVYFTPPNPVIDDSIHACVGNVVNLQVSGAETYLWSGDPAIQNLTSASLSFTPTNSGYLYCDFINSCGVIQDSVYLQLHQAIITASPDTTICFGGSALLSAFGGVSYVWSPNTVVQYVNASQISVKPYATTTYTVVGTDWYGCQASDQVTVFLHPIPSVLASPDVYASYGEVISLNATGNSIGGSYMWSPPEFLSCINCADPISTTNQSMTYLVQFTDVNGCVAYDQVSISFEAFVYVPNTFTPGDGLNATFFAKGVNVKSIRIDIYDRWGELIYSINGLNDYWDGTYQGAACQDGTYVWKMEYTDFEDREYKTVGHVNVLR